MLFGVLENEHAFAYTGSSEYRFAAGDGLNPATIQAAATNLRRD